MYTIRVNDKKIYAEGGTLLSVLRENDIFIPSPCGGRGTCGKCRVFGKNGAMLACHTSRDREMEITLPEKTDTSIMRMGRRRRTISCGGSGFGIAFDIGTTTIAGYLVNLADGEIIASEAQINKQCAYGADVMSRVHYCISQGTEELCEVIHRQLDEMSANLSGSLPVSRTVIAGNTIMEHIYMNADMSGLAFAPFSPAFLDAVTAGSVTLMPCASAYIGGDIISSMLSCDMDSETRTVLLIDAGTNGEMVLLHNGIYYCCSVSAGPALEGAGISCGTGSISGAVCAFEFVGGMPCIRTIGERPAVGICGSGLIDVIAQLSENNIIDVHGTFLPKTDIPREFARYYSGGKFSLGSVSVTQDDIRQYQTVKSAIRSGISMLLAHARITADDVEEVFMCGGLGSALNVKSACRTGLLPPQFTAKTSLCGNTSGSGAAAAVCDMGIISAGESLKERMRLIELGGSPEFERSFIKNMILSDRGNAE